MKTIFMASILVSAMSGADADLMKYIHESSSVNPQKTAVIYAYMQEYSHVCEKSPTLSGVKRFESYKTFIQLVSPSNVSGAIGVNKLQATLLKNSETIICE